MKKCVDWKFVNISMLDVCPSRLVLTPMTVSDALLKQC